jgi:hypothetical protein
MTDSFKTFARSLTSPAESARAIEPSDAGDLPRVTRALHAGRSGDVAVTFASPAGGLVRTAGGALVTW